MDAMQRNRNGKYPQRQSILVVRFVRSAHVCWSCSVQFFPSFPFSWTSQFLRAFAYGAFAMWYHVKHLFIFFKLRILLVRRRRRRWCRCWWNCTGRHFVAKCSLDMRNIRSWIPLSPIEVAPMFSTKYKRCCSITFNTKQFFFLVPLYFLSSHTLRCFSAKTVFPSPW